MNSTEQQEVAWRPPGPGQWVLGRHMVRPLTPLIAGIHAPAYRDGFAAGFERLGVPLRYMDEALVNGVAYNRAVPLVDKPGSPPPPGPILKLASRLHPEFRRRNRQARATLVDQDWRRWIDRWHTHDSPAWAARHDALQAIDLAELSDADLATHLADVVANAHAALAAHFELAPMEGIGIGHLLVEGGDRWGLTADDVLPTLSGASPATTEAIRDLAALRQEVGDRPVATLDEVRAMSPAAARELDGWLDRHRWWMLTGYDLDGLTIGEMPSAIVGAITAPPVAQVDAGPAIDALLEKVPAADRARASELVSAARDSHALRDAVGANTVEWPVGLVRRAVLEIGRRAGFDRHEHAVEATHDELARATGNGYRLAEHDLASRRARRYAIGRNGMPDHLGDPEPPPPVDSLPPHLATAARIGLAIMQLEWGEAASTAVDDDVVSRGDGIGTAPVTGRARVLQEPRADVVIEPGDILVAPFTTPTWSVLLANVAGLVVEEGGLAAHAAIVARELELPAVIGARGACDLIADLATIELDPSTGTVRVVDVTNS